MVVSFKKPFLEREKKEVTFFHLGFSVWAMLMEGCSGQAGSGRILEPRTRLIVGPGRPPSPRIEPRRRLLRPKDCCRPLSRTSPAPHQPSRHRLPSETPASRVVAAGAVGEAAAARTAMTWDVETVTSTFWSQDPRLLGTGTGRVGWSLHFLVFIFFRLFCFIFLFVLLLKDGLLTRIAVYMLKLEGETWKSCGGWGDTNNQADVLFPVPSLFCRATEPAVARALPGGVPAATSPRPPLEPLCLALKTPRFFVH